MQEEVKSELNEKKNEQEMMVTARSSGGGVVKATMASKFQKDLSKLG